MPELYLDEEFEVVSNYDGDNDYIYEQVKYQDVDGLRRRTCEIINRVNDYVHGDDKILAAINEIVKSAKPEGNPHYYCDANLIKKIRDQIELFNKLRDTDGDECCICLDKCQFCDRSYFMCKHFVCNGCYKISEFVPGDTRCPICRAVIQQYIFSDKYAIICTGIPTKLYTFENGGYRSVCICYFPEFKGENSTVFNGITYHDENENRKAFMQQVSSLLSSGYTVILQRYMEVKRWMQEMMMKDLVNDKRLIYE
jgi:hypothetical protein